MEEETEVLFYIVESLEMSVNSQCALWVETCSHMQLLCKPVCLLAAKEGFWIAAKLRFGFLQTASAKLAVRVQSLQAFLISYVAHIPLHVCCSCVIPSFGFGWIGLGLSWIADGSQKRV